MHAQRPFASRAALLAAADAVWTGLTEADYLEAFAHHPRIGEDLAALRARFPDTAGWASAEQAGASAADEPTLLALRDENRAYFERFGFIFIVCASGKSARELLASLRDRLGNERPHELAIAATEQAKITRLRLEKLSP
jgi:2-oxo-4-hydroxy-4-carboxy-5-ureidoimidazoline decarboxylase